MADNKGFLDQIGVGAQDEGALRRQAMLEANARGDSGAARAFRLGQQGSGLVHGAANAIGGLITGQNDGRSVGGLAANARAGFRNRNDQLDAAAAGITQNQLKTRREIRAATADFEDDGTFANRIALAKQVAQIAQDNGDFSTMANALRQVSELEKEQLKFQQLGIETEQAARDNDLEREVGFSGRLITDGKNAPETKFVRINDGPDAGKYLAIQAGKEDQVVDGGDIIPKDAGRRVLAQDTLQGLARANGASSGKINELRGQVTSMGENAQIVRNIVGTLSNLADPQAALDASGRVGIAVDKTVSFVDSLASVFGFGTPEGDSKTTYNGKPVSTEKQRSEFIKSGRETGIERFAKENGFNSARDMLPQHLQDNTVAAEQYWANIMELAYLDARLMEPSNRGLSDNDIQNALKRIGADTANPISFALRQREVITTKLLPQLENLGSNFSTFDSQLYTKQDIQDAVYGVDAKARIREQLEAAVAELDVFIAGGRRGQGEGAGAQLSQEQDDGTFLENF